MKLSKGLLILPALIFAFNCSFAQWAVQTSGTSERLNSISAPSATDVFIAGNGGMGLKSTNGGNLWQSMNISIFTQNSIRFLNASTGISAGESQTIYMTSNGGFGFSQMGIGTTTINDFFFDPSVLPSWFIGDLDGANGFLYNSNTNTSVIIPETVGISLRGISCPDLNSVWIVGEAGLILKGDNTTLLWTSQVSGTSTTLNKVMFLDINNGIAIGNNGVILRTTNGGNNWSTIVSGTNQNLNGIYNANMQNAWICGDNGTILFSNDGGLTWTSETSNTIENLNGIHGSGINNVWACGDNGTIIHHISSLSIEENINDSVSIYPNPSNGIITLECAESINSVSLANLNGSLNIKLTGSLNEIDLSTFPKGVYFVKITTNSGVTVKKILLD